MQEPCRRQYHGTARTIQHGTMKSSVSHDTDCTHVCVRHDIDSESRLCIYLIWRGVGPVSGASAYNW